MRASSFLNPYRVDLRFNELSFKLIIQVVELVNVWTSLIDSFETNLLRKVFNHNLHNLILIWIYLQYSNSFNQNYCFHNDQRFWIAQWLKYQQIAS